VTFDGGLSATPSLSEIAVVDDLYHNALLAAIGDDGKTGVVKRHFWRVMDVAIDRGYIFTDPAEALKRMHWERVSRQSSDNTKQMIYELEAGQTALDVDEWLEVPVTVGKGKRTTRGRVIPSDFDLIIAVRRKHADESEAVLDRTIRVSGMTVAQITAHGSMKAAVKAGGLLTFGSPPALGTP
jgi:hypothetical protein